MKKIFLKQNWHAAGFTLLELILAVAIFSGSAIATGYLMIEAMGTTDANSKKIQATYLAREGLEAARIIRDSLGFSELDNGDHGVEYDTVGQTWEFVSAPDTTDEVYERTINIDDWDGDGDGNTKIITSMVRVPTLTRDITVTLKTLLSNWPES